MKDPAHVVLLHLLTGLLLSGAMQDAAAQMNKCVGSDGKVTYQQRPCDGAVVIPPPVSKAAPALTPAAGSKIAPAITTSPSSGAPPSLSAPPARPAASAPPAGRENPANVAATEPLNRDAYALGVMAWCEDRVPGYKRANASWRTANSRLIRQIETDVAGRVDSQRGYEFMTVTWLGYNLGAYDDCAPFSRIVANPPSARSAESANAEPLKPRLLARDMKLEELAFMMGAIDWCSVNIPEYRKEYGTDRWRARNASVAADLAAKPAYRARHADTMRLLSQGPPPTDYLVLTTCTQTSAAFHHYAQRLPQLGVAEKGARR